LRQEVTDPEEGVAAFRAVGAFAATGGDGLTVPGALLPALVALGLIRALDAPAAVYVAAASLAAVVGGAKLAAMVWGLAIRFTGRSRLPINPAPIG
jgi:hypothetical protein